MLAVLMTAAAPLLVYAAFRNAVMDVAAESAADPSTSLLPHSAAPPMRAVMRVAQHPKRKLPADAVAVARLAAVKLPLAYEPYFIAARAQEQAGRYDRATALMEEARRRRPSSPSVRVALLGYYSLASAYQKAIDEADMAMRINGYSMSLILPAFAKLVALDPKARKAIAVALAKRPPWQEAFLSAAAAANMKPDVARMLVADVRQLAPSRKPQAEEAFLVQSLVNAGQYRAARSLFESYLTGEGRPPVVIDGRFNGTKSMAPFNWTLYTNPNGTAELGAASPGGRRGLDVSFFGDDEVVLAEQTLAAAPGTYVLASTTRGESSSAEVGLAWSLVCLPSRQSVAMLPLQPLNPSATRKATSVTIPSAGCEGQQLALVGKPAEISRMLDAQISDVTLVPAGNARR